MYQERLTYIKPGQTIDQLKDKVTAFKKENIELRQQIVGTD